MINGKGCFSKYSFFSCYCCRCDDGFYGIPTQRGSFCQLCDCGGGPCDRITGQCLGCRGNTEGKLCTLT